MVSVSTAHGVPCGLRPGLGSSVCSILPRAPRVMRNWQKWLSKIVEHSNESQPNHGSRPHRTSCMSDVRCATTSTWKNGCFAIQVPHSKLKTRILFQLKRQIESLVDRDSLVVLPWLQRVRPHSPVDEAPPVLEDPGLRLVEPGRRVGPQPLPERRRTGENLWRRMNSLVQFPTP